MNICQLVYNEVLIPLLLLKPVKVNHNNIIYHYLARKHLKLTFLNFLEV